MIDLKKRVDENEYQYLYRMGQLVDSGKVENWRSITPIINEQLRDDTSEYRDESAYRKGYQAARTYWNNVFCYMLDDEFAKNLAAERDELYKVKRQVADQRREYNKLLTADARADHLSERLLEAAEKLNDERPLFIYNKNDISGENDAVLCFADWHFGMVTDNLWNTYNTEICRKRVSELVLKTKKHLALHEVDTLHVLLLGDGVHGAIHTGCRVASEEDTCDQLMQVSELMATTISSLSESVNFVKVYSTYGNHARTIQNKKDSVHSDNMEKIIPWWMRERFKNSYDIEVIDSDYKEFIKLNVKGCNICATHGDLDKFKDLGVTVNTLFTKKFGETIDMTISADKHHLEEFEQLGIESVLVRSLCGTDEFANNNRLYSSPGQSLFIFNEEDGRSATYSIKLS